MVHERVLKFQDFIKSLDKKEKVALVFDSDPDGTCAAVILAKAITHLRRKRPDIILAISHKDQDFCQKVIETAKNKKANKVITVDHAFDQHPNRVKQLASFSKLLIIDHHKLYHDYDSENVLLIKPQIVQSKIEPSQYCSAKFVYDLSSALADVSDMDWVAVLGILADATYPSWKTFVHKTLRRNRLKRKKEIFDTRLGKVSNLLAYYDIYTGGEVRRLFDVLYEAKSYKDVLASGVRIAHVVGREINYYLKNYERFSEIVDGTLIVHIKPKYRIGSIVSTVLSIKNPKKTIMVIQEIGQKVFVSGRRQDFKIRVNDLLEKSVEGIPHSVAGGHIPASGAFVPKKFYNRFYENLVREIKAFHK